MSDDKTRISQRFTGADVGTQLSGIYELDARVATGGMGEVYRGHNIQTGDAVAIKIVLPEFAHDQTILSLFRKEASILNHLSHDAVVRYHVFTIDPGIGRPYLAMEFVDGESLFDVLRRGPMPADEVCRLCHRLTSGLSAVHQAGAIHRDLSPDNIILPGGNVERAKIVDFGIARSETVGGGTLIDGKFAGKYNYVSPEQLGLFGGQVSAQSDIYSLGLVLAAALRGKPIDMSGSQLDVVEKRRTVPDLADIDIGFRPLLEAMLQPLPANRPHSMAEIAGMTRDGIVDAGGTRPPARDDGRLADGDGWRVGEPDRSRPPDAAAAPGFVEHRRPSYLSGERPQPAIAPSEGAAPTTSTPRRTAGLAAAAASLALVAGLAGAYWGGLVGSSGRPAPESGAAALTPAPEPAPAAASEQPAAATQANETTNAGPDAPDTAAAGGAPAAPQPGAPAPAETSAAERLAEALAQKPASKVQSQTDAGGGVAASSPKPPAEPAAAADSSTKIETEQTKAESPSAVPAVKEASPAAAAKAAEAAPEPTAAAAEQVSGQEGGQPKSSAVEEKPANLPQPVETGPAPPPPEAEAAAGPARKEQANSAPPARQGTPAPTTAQADARARISDDRAASDVEGEQVVAMTNPKPDVPTGEAIDGMAQRISWLRAYRGGDCFYASAIAATDKSIEIEGFGTAVEPFAQMESAFEAKFHLEPEIDVRLIEPSQCQVADFLGALSAGNAERPQLHLDRTSIPDGSTLSGILRTGPGLKSSMLLIDHKGMMFNLDDRVVVAGNQASFNIPIGLGAADRSLGKPVPQIVLVVTGPRPLQAAEVPAPVKADEALPRILSEIREKGGAFSATAKYFRLGG